MGAQHLSLAPREGGQRVGVPPSSLISPRDPARASGGLGFAKIPGKLGQQGILAGARVDFVYSSTNSPNYAQPTDYDIAARGLATSDAERGRL